MFNTSDLFDSTDEQYTSKVKSHEYGDDDYKRKVYLEEGSVASFYFDDGSVRIESGCFDVVLSAEEMKKLIYEYQHFPSTSELAHIHCANLS
jgi:hypothetical protein